MTKRSKKSKKGGIEVSSLVKWIILLIFLILVLIIIAAVRSSGDGMIGSICEKTRGLIGC